MDIKVSTIVLLILCVLDFIVCTGAVIEAIMNYRDIKSKFTCEHCNTLNENIDIKRQCKSCKRKIPEINGTWRYFMICRVQSLNTRNIVEDIKFKDYTKLCKIEIAVCIAVTIVMILMAVLLIFVL